MTGILAVMKHHEVGMRLAAQSGRALALDARACQSMADELRAAREATERLVVAARLVRDLTRNPWPRSDVITDAGTRASASLDQAIRDFENP